MTAPIIPRLDYVSAQQHLDRASEHCAVCYWTWGDDGDGVIRFHANHAADDLCQAALALGFTLVPIEAAVAPVTGAASTLSTDAAPVSPVSENPHGAERSTPLCASAPHASDRGMSLPARMADQHHAGPELTDEEKTILAAGGNVFRDCYFRAAAEAGYVSTGEYVEAVTEKPGFDGRAFVTQDGTRPFDDSLAILGDMA